MKVGKASICLICLLLLNGCNDGWEFKNTHHQQQQEIQGKDLSPSQLSDVLNTLYYLTVTNKTPNDLPFASSGPGVPRQLTSNKAFVGQPDAQGDLIFDSFRPFTITDGGAPSKWASDWHCYQSEPLTVVVDVDGMTLDGELTEYEYSGGCKPSNLKLASYEFEHAHLNKGLIFDSGEVKDRIHNRFLKPNQLLLDSMATQIEGLFGKAWLAQWKRGAEHAGQDFLKLDRDGHLVYDQLPPELIDYNSLNQDELLDGTLFGGKPGGAPASPQWCRIVNIPTGFGLKSQMVQTVIAVNCARSTKRYCEGHGGYSAGMLMPTSPLAWSDEIYHNAMLNTKEQQQRNKQGHFIVRSSAQNAFSVSPYGVAPFSGALKAVYGYTDIKDANQDSETFNNAGSNSFVGHAGHCQNEMSDEATTTGLSFEQITVNGVTGVDFITQDFQ